MTTADVGSVTALLRQWRDGESRALDRLIPLVYDELRRLAAVHLRGERSGHTFRTTDLVSEAYLKLSAGEVPTLNDRVHFFAVAARSMRQILVDHSRMKAAVKRDAGNPPVTFDDGLVAADRPEELVALDEALHALSAQDERKARVIELHYFGGLTLDEVASVLDVHVATVGRDLKLAEAWIHRHIHRG